MESLISKTFGGLDDGVDIWDRSDESRRSRVNLHQLTAEQLGAGSTDPVGAESLLWTIPATSSPSPADDFRRRCCDRIHVSRCVLSQQCGSLDISLVATRVWSDSSRRLDLLRRSSVFGKTIDDAGRYSICDSWPPAPNFRRRRTAQTAARKGRIDGQHSSCVFWIVRLGNSCRRESTVCTGWLAGRHRRRLAAERDCPSAVRKSTRGNAGNQPQCVRRIRNSTTKSNC